MTHVLIIDDNRDDLDVMAEMLNHAGVASTIIQDTGQLGQIVPTLPPVDVIFLDLEMPGMNGYEVFEYLKAHTDLRAPVIACTVNFSQMNEIRKLGFQGFLGKPLSLTRFQEHLRRILNGEAVWELK
jgi:CheY-like chemotaxis protein